MDYWEIIQFNMAESLDELGELCSVILSNVQYDNCRLVIASRNIEEDESNGRREYEFITAEFSLPVGAVRPHRTDKIIWSGTKYTIEKTVSGTYSIFTVHAKRDTPKTIGSDRVQGG